MCYPFSSEISTTTTTTTTTAASDAVTILKDIVLCYTISNVQY